MIYHNLKFRKSIYLYVLQIYFYNIAKMHKYIKMHILKIVAFWKYF